MAMLSLLDALVEMLGGREVEGIGPLAVEKYRRLDQPDGPVVYITPLGQSERPLAIGGQYTKRLRVEIRCEVPWTEGSSRMGDAVVNTVDDVLARLLGNREIGGTRRGRVGEVTYFVRIAPQGRPVFVARIPAEFEVDSGSS
ncbi:MAG: hypothetical protein H5T86_14435 [Armatimonadetes bacterium]|nr:hypothetical protein [Armatimonadota bacterium]